MAQVYFRKHPLALRWNHWINFPLLTIMVWSGLMIYWANPAYILPGSFLNAIGLDHRLADGMAWHFVFALFFIVNGVAYVTFLLFTGHWRYLMPDRRALQDAVLIAASDFKIYRGPRPTRVKYNPAQRLSYLVVLLLGILMTATGLAIYKPIQLNWLTAAFGGYAAARWIHFYVTVLFVLFFIVHVIQVIREGWPAFAAMFSGLERRHEK